MKIISGIYCIINNINNKKYVGLFKNCYKRWWDHREAAKRPRKECQKRVPLYNAMRKYGLDNFSFEIYASIYDIIRYKNRFELK